MNESGGSGSPATRVQPSNAVRQVNAPAGFGCKAPATKATGRNSLMRGMMNREVSSTVIAATIKSGREDTHMYKRNWTVYSSAIISRIHTGYIEYRFTYMY